MIFKNNRLLFSAFILCLPSFLSADLTTLQSWDPIPVFNAANLNTPPDTQFCTLVKRQIIDDVPGKRRKIGINFSPFMQRAVRGQAGPNSFFGDYPGTLTPNPNGGPDTNVQAPGTALSDMNGTAYLMGLFLGADENGNGIWGLGNVDTGDAVDITYTTVTTTLLNLNLQNAAMGLNGISQANPTVIPSTNCNTLIYNVATNPNGPPEDQFTAPSILSQSALDQDATLFGAFSVPLIYQKTGLRWELNFDISDNFGFIFRGGVAQIAQYAQTSKSLSSIVPPSTTTTTTPTTIFSELSTVGAAQQAGAGNAITLNQPLAQAIFEQWVDDNIDDLLDPTYGADYNIQSYYATGLEDLRFIFFARHSFAMHPHEENDYTPMLITPYAVFGYTLPMSGPQNYSQLYALPLGNSGHASFDTLGGLTFDFLDSVELGFEAGATFFQAEDILQMPCPNHILQRVIYPYRRNLNVAPGCNWHFSASLNAIDFIKNISFISNYNFVQHTADTITPMAGSIGNQYFFPNYLEDLSPWTSQLFTAALDFKLQPGIHFSLAWQGALSQTNAYCSNTVLGSLNFLF